MTTTAVSCKLFWNDDKVCKSIPIDVYGNNVATFHLATGNNAFHAYCTSTIIDEYDRDPLLQMEVESTVGTRPLACDWTVAGGVAGDRTIREDQSHGNAR